MLQKYEYIAKYILYTKKNTAIRDALQKNPVKICKQRSKGTNRNRKAKYVDSEAEEQTGIESDYKDNESKEQTGF